MEPITNSPFSRRELLRAASWACLFGSVAPACGGEQATPLRTIAFNVGKCRGWPPWSFRARRLRDRGQMPARFAAALANEQPQVITFAEAPSRQTCQAVARQLKMNVAYFGSAKSYPGALFTHADILQQQSRPAEGLSKELFTRHWGRAVLRRKDDSKLVVHSVHLYPNRQATRRAEIAVLLKAAAADLKTHTDVLLQGDFNFTPDSQEYRLLTAAGWIDTFAQVGQGDGRTFPSAVPLQRIDYVFASPTLAKRLKQSRPLSGEVFTWGNSGYALSDHLPVLAVFD